MSSGYWLIIALCDDGRFLNNLFFISFKLNRGRTVTLYFRESIPFLASLLKHHFDYRKLVCVSGIDAAGETLLTGHAESLSPN